MPTPSNPWEISVETTTEAVTHDRFLEPGAAILNVYPIPPRLHFHETESDDCDDEEETSDDGEENIEPMRREEAKENEQLLPLALIIKGEIKTETNGKKIDNRIVFLKLPHGSDCKLEKFFEIYWHNDIWKHRLAKHGNVILRNAQGFQRDLFRIALRHMKRNVDGAMYSGERDPETGREVGSEPREKRKYFRKSLPANRCPFCKCEVTEREKCTFCTLECFGVCATCRSMGAPALHAPRRMTYIHTKAGKKEPCCFPHCSRKYASQCESCNRWIAKDLMGKMLRREGNRRRALCTDCIEKRNITACASCHSVIEQRTQWKDSQGFKCERCFSRNNNFKTKNVKMQVVTKSKNVKRTYGIELEINDVHKCEYLAQEIADLNIGGVQFNVWPDGSVHHGMELVSFPAEKAVLLAAIKEMCKRVRKYKHTYNQAGLHVHIKEEGIDVAGIFKLWLALEPFTFSLLPEYRKSEWGRMLAPDAKRFAQALDSIGSEEEARKWHGSSRYTSCNLLALDEHGTIEIRCHHATTDYREIYHWLSYLNAIWEVGNQKLEDRALQTIRALAEKATKEREPLHVREALRLPAITCAHFRKQQVIFSKLDAEAPAPSRFHFNNATLINTNGTVQPRTNGGPYRIVSPHAPTAFNFWTMRRAREWIAGNYQLQNGRPCDGTHATYLDIP